MKNAYFAGLRAISSRDPVIRKILAPTYRIIFSHHSLLKSNEKNSRLLRPLFIFFYGKNKGKALKNPVIKGFSLSRPVRDKNGTSGTSYPSERLNAGPATMLSFGPCPFLALKISLIISSARSPSTPRAGRT